MNQTSLQSATDSAVTLQRGSTLRRWFDHDPERWEEFNIRYKDELAHQQDVIDELRELTEDETVTLLYGAKDVDHNNAVILKEVLEAGR
ncbi:DUF488 domain-containing protein [Haladaptatus sp.]|uniref:DUF488 domain-containing protein n=1 Tax=Haladaptatus sp. TaxID=1973141 RepID=UPI003C6780B8